MAPPSSSPDPSRRRGIDRLPPGRRGQSPARGAARRLALGRRGEQIAAQAYRARGYRVLASNWRAGRAGELDLVLARAATVVICEVKARTSDRFGVPAEAVDHRKQRRIRALAARFVAEEGLRPATIRFDVASVLAGRVELIEDAF